MGVINVDDGHSDWLQSIRKGSDDPFVLSGLKTIDGDTENEITKVYKAVFKDPDIDGVSDQDSDTGNKKP